MKIQGFIFDLDGVLTDTAEYHFLGWKRLADELGIPFTRQENEALRGVARRESLLHLLKGRIVPEVELLALMDRKNRYYLEFIHAITPQDVLPGAREFLMEVRAAGLRSALGSASRNARDVLARLELSSLVDVIADGHSVARQKPAPDLFLYAARQLGLPPAHCVVVEDAAAGIEAARLGGFLSVGLGPLERVGRADAIFSSLAGVRLQEVQLALESK